MFQKLFTLIVLLGITCQFFSFHPPKKVQEKEYIGAMTFNIRYSNPNDAPNDWSNRRDWVGDLIHFYNPDIIGTQEVLHGQLMDMQERLPEYDHVGVARGDGKKEGEYSAIFYKKDKYELIRSATFWLSETPEKPGTKGWDAALPRIVTWGEFKDKATGMKFFFF